MSFRIDRRKFLKASGAVAGMMALSPSRLFSKNKPTLSFGIVTDSHYADRAFSGDRYYRESVAKMGEAMDEMNKQKVDFVVHLGDFKDQAEKPTESTTLEFLKKIESVYANFKGPRYHVLGNHDMDSISKEQFLVNVLNTGIPNTKSFYSFDKKGIHFVVLDACYTKEGVSYDKGNFVWSDCFIPANQIDWLRKDLSATNLPTIVFVHQLLDDADDKQLCVFNAPEVRKVLSESAKVLAVFQGHQHKNRYSFVDDIHYCTLPGMVDFSGLENNCYTVVKVEDSGVNMIGYKRASSRKMG